MGDKTYRYSDFRRNHAVNEHTKCGIYPNEIPGIKLPDNVRRAMDLAGDDPIKSRMEGVNIARELVDAAREKFKGIYLITPFLRYEMTAELTKYIREVDSKHTSEVAVHE